MKNLLLTELIILIGLNKKPNYKPQQIKKFIYLSYYNKHLQLQSRTFVNIVNVD